MRQRVTHAALKQYYPGGGYRNRFRVLPEFDCVYVKNAKAACSTVTLWLHRAHTGDHSPMDNIHKTNRLPRPREIGWDRVARMLDGEAFRFTFVRQPIRRAESAFLDKIVRADQERWRSELRQALGQPDSPGEPLTLEEYVDALEASDPIRMDSHFRPQHLNLMHPLVGLDHIGRVENFDADLARVRELTGLPDAPVEVRNATHRDGSLFDGKPGLLRRVEAIYAQDFELYGY